MLGLDRGGYARVQRAKRRLPKRPRAWRASLSIWEGLTYACKKKIVNN